MKYERIQKMFPLFKRSRVAYHLAMAAAAAHEDGDSRRDQILELMTDDERDTVREAYRRSK